MTPKLTGEGDEEEEEGAVPKKALAFSTLKSDF